jgi:hypothetical protein
VELGSHSRYEVDSHSTRNSPLEILRR